MIPLIRYLWSEAPARIVVLWVVAVVAGGIYLCAML